MDSGTVPTGALFTKTRAPGTFALTARLKRAGCGGWTTPPSGTSFTGRFSGLAVMLMTVSKGLYFSMKTRTR